MFLGFDLSTQQLKIVAVDATLRLPKCYTVDFDKDLPHYKTTHGVYKVHETQIHAPVEMWLEALDLIFARMKKDNFPFSDVRGLCGSCQQHGLVYWSEEANSAFSNLKPDVPLKSLFPEAFSHPYSPNWQDHSTVDECKFFTDKAGGPEKLAKITGSCAHHRFTGPQLRKFIRDFPGAYAKTGRISLVLSFLASVLLGAIARIDEADATGMNLYDIEKREWNDYLLETCVSGLGVSASGLAGKLDSVEPVGYRSIGSISQYFVGKYGFHPDCRIYPFTGDNLATVLSLPLLTRDILISLGTLTTVLLITDKYRPSSAYHIMMHPTNPKLFMYMICYSNGALPRNRIRDRVNEVENRTKDSWERFSQILESSEYPASDDGKIGVYFPQGEIVPNVNKSTITRFSFDKNTGSLKSHIREYENVQTDVKGIVESQALSCRIRVSGLLGNSGVKPHKLFYVGGSSRNLAIVRKFSEILGCESGNFRSLEPNGCALGGAFKASWSFAREFGSEEASYESYLENNFDWGGLEKFDAADKWEKYKMAELALRNLEKVL